MYLRFFDCFQIAAMLIGTLGMHQRRAANGYMYAAKLRSAYQAHYLRQLLALMKQLLFDLCDVSLTHEQERRYSTSSNRRFRRDRYSLTHLFLGYKALEFLYSLAQLLRRTLGLAQLLYRVHMQATTR